MKIFLLGLVIIPCSCILKNPNPPKPIVYPDKDLQEISINSQYDPLKKEFRYAGSSYCYNKEKNKEPIFDKNFKVRIYDKTGKILAEDFLRLRQDKSEHDPVFYVAAYIPYYEESSVILTIKLEDKKEILLSKFGNIDSQKKLREESVIKDHPLRREMVVYDEKTECHYPPYHP